MVRFQLNANQQRIVKFLFFNPFASVQAISVNTGLSLPQTRRALEHEAFIGEEIAIQTAPFHKRFYIPTHPAQRSVCQYSRNPAEAADILTMNYEGKLERFRIDIVQQIRQVENISWTVSPWKIRAHSQAFFHGLIQTELPGGWGYCLKAYYLLDDYDSFTNLLPCLQEWKIWRKTTQIIPSTLTIISESFEEIEQNHPLFFLFEDLAQEGNGGVVVTPSIFKNTTWSRMTQLGQNLIYREPYFFVARKRQSRWPHERKDEGPVAWLQKNGDQAESLAANALSLLDEKRIRLLTQVAKFPGLRFRQHTQIEKFSSLDCEMILIWKLVDFGMDPEDKRMYLTAAGLKFLSAIAGLSPKAYNEASGLPYRKKRFSNQLDHLVTVSETLLQLQREGFLYRWQAKYFPHTIRRQIGAGYQKVIITPDGTGGLGKFPFLVDVWFEYDRGTRRGDKLHTQLSKYFVASQINRGYLPPIFYLIDDYRGYHQARFNWIVKELAKFNPRNFPLFILTDVSRIDPRYRRNPLSRQKIWQFFTNGQLVDRLLSVSDLLDIFYNLSILNEKTNNRFMIHVCTELDKNS